MSEPKNCPPPDPDSVPEIEAVSNSGVAAPTSRPFSYWLKRLLACNPFFLVSAALEQNRCVIARASPRSAGFQTCRIADFQIGSAPKIPTRVEPFASQIWKSATQPTWKSALRWIRRHALIARI